MSKRKKITVTERYAAVILDLRRGDGTPVVDREAAKHLTAGEIVSMFESALNFDHGVYAAFGGSSHPTNITPRTIADHKAKTSKDITAIAKAKRIAKQHEEFRTRLLAKSGLADDVAKTDTASTKSRSKWATRPMAGNRSSAFKKKMDGTVERRTGK